MFTRTTLTSRPVITSAAILGAGAATVYFSHQRPVRFDSAIKPAAGVSAQRNLETTNTVAKKTFTFPIWSHDLKVSSVEQVNHDTKRITFDLPSKDEISGIPSSAAILTQHTPPGAWFPVFRPYTPISDVDTPGTLSLLVKKYPSGRASGHLHSLTPGSTLRVRGPLPGYTYTPSPSTPRTVLLIAGGAGITPIYSLTKGILSNPSDKTRIELVWGVNGTRDIILGSELEALEKQYPDRLNVTYAVSGPSSSVISSKHRPGYINTSLLREIISQKCETPDTQWGDSKGTKVFLCGPPAMEESIVGGRAGAKVGVLGELGIEKKSVYRF